MTTDVPLQRLNKRQVNRYLQNNACSINLSLKSQIPQNLLFVFDKIYQCADDRILAVSKDGTGNLYSSVSDAELLR
jgi:hypothetical protein